MHVYQNTNTGAIEISDAADTRLVALSNWLEVDASLAPTNAAAILARRAQEITLRTVAEADRVAAAPLRTGSSLTELPSAATAAVRAALARNLRSVTIALIGDSTGDSLDQTTGAPNTEWFSVLGILIGRRYPGWTVLHRRWNPGSTVEGYDMPTVIQQGTLGGGDDRYADLVSGTLQYASTFATASDIDVMARVMPNDGWAPGGSSALRTIVCRYSTTSTNRGWYLALNETGNLVFVWSTNGTSDTDTIVSTAAVPYSNGSPGWVRALFDVDNGASGNTVTFQTSTNGTTWTNLGSPVVTSGTTSMANGNLTYYLGSINNTPTNKLNGRIYWVEVRSGLPGSGVQTLQVPPLPDWWDQATIPGAGILWGGAPVLMLLNGSATGQSIAYFNDSTRRGRLNSPHAQALLFLSDGHNESTPTAYGWRTSLSAWLTDVRGRVWCPIVVSTQNPSIKGSARADQETADWTTVRGPVTLALATTVAGMYPLDVRPQFTNLPVQLAADGLHPTPAASQVWGTYVYNQIFGVG